ncbi:ABC transporter ATP-binding protein [Streptomyces sp. SP18BB07]|uniref:ABC transporter ATP-binding protein n=1 Tax=Streptomyces sp. SP18BB07 TaxID=3002522 RepID=UPI002E76FE76|nr:ABC transporter ATP-binding protein [Streptomyces sp. SP18BB07]MEE1763515.1 ABC transporter ATP-binding protein [Streptomyces sp. SP18BB07]
MPPPPPPSPPPTSTGAPGTPVIDIRDVRRAYGGEGPPALDGVSLRVRAGEAVSVIGPSGSGKSTLLNLIAGLDRPSSGSVTVDGVRVDRLGEAGSARYRRAKVGMVFQFFNLLDDLTVVDNVLLPAQLAGLGRAEARRRAAGLLEYLRIDRHTHAYPGRLSGGERQRVAVARALMNRPALLLADEPTGALDSASGDDVRALLTDLNADGQTIVLVTHDPRLARACAHRTVELVDGRIVRDAPHDDRRGDRHPDVRENPRNDPGGSENIAGSQNFGGSQNVGGSGIAAVDR